MAHGELWVACTDDTCHADQLELLVHPSLNVIPGEEFDPRHWEPPEDGRVGPPEGREADTREPLDSEPPGGWLSSLWEGGMS